MFSLDELAELGHDDVDLRQNVGGFGFVCFTDVLRHEAVKLCIGHDDSFITFGYIERIGQVKQHRKSHALTGSDRKRVTVTRKSGNCGQNFLELCGCELGQGFEGLRYGVDLFVA